MKISSKIRSGGLWFSGLLLAAAVISLASASTISTSLTQNFGFTNTGTSSFGNSEPRDFFSSSVNFTADSQSSLSPFFSSSSTVRADLTFQPSNDAQVSVYKTFANGQSASNFFNNTSDSVVDFDGGFYFGKLGAYLLSDVVAQITKIGLTGDNVLTGGAFNIAASAGNTEFSKSANLITGGSASLKLSIADAPAAADVPAPAGLFLLALGLIGGGLLMRRRQQI